MIYQLRKLTAVDVKRRILLNKAAIESLNYIIIFDNRACRAKTRFNLVDYNVLTTASKQIP